MIEKEYEYREQISYKPFGEVKDRLFSITNYQLRMTNFEEKIDFEMGLADHGVRKYDNSLGQFTSIDPLWEKYYSWTPYHYSLNNPLGRKDENGKWAPSVHELIVRRACEGLGFSEKQIDAIVYGNIAVDEDQDNQYKHAMVNQGESKSEKREKANDFVNENLDAFDKTGMLYFLGQATHTVADQEASTHKNWAIWYPGGVINPLNWPHLLGDYIDGNWEEYFKAVK